MHKKPINVYTLLGHSDSVFFDMSLSCLKSFCAHCKDDYKLIILEDGTLTISDKDVLQKSLHKLTIVSDSDTREQVSDLIYKYPYISKYRKSKQVLARKLIDIPLLSKEDYCYIDSDIYFIRDFSGINRTLIENEDFVNMQDYQNAYFLSFYELHLSKNRIKLPAKVNTGMLFVRKNKFSLDIIENYLKLFELNFTKPKPVDSWRYNLIEQTCWAALSTHINSYYWDPRQVYIPINKNVITKNTIALHFVSRLRHLFEKIVEKSNKIKDSDIVELNTIPIKYSNIFKNFTTVIKNKFLNYNRLKNG